MNKSESKYFNTAQKMDKALIALLEEKPFEYITVSEICKKAGVNRSTFYLHYENTADLLGETAKYILDGFASYFKADAASIISKFRECPLDELNFVSDKYLHPYLTYIKDNQSVFLTALLHSSSFGFGGIFQRLFENVFNPVLERFGYPESDRRYAMMFYLNGITALVTEWLKDGCQKTVEEVSQIIYGCIFGRGTGTYDAPGE